MAVFLLSFPKALHHPDRGHQQHGKHDDTGDAVNPVKRILEYHQKNYRKEENRGDFVPEPQLQRRMPEAVFPQCGLVP